MKTKKKNSKMAIWIAGAVILGLAGGFTLYSGAVNKDVNSLFKKEMDGRYGKARESFSGEISDKLLKVLEGKTGHASSYVRTEELIHGGERRLAYLFEDNKYCYKMVNGCNYIVALDGWNKDSRDYRIEQSEEVLKDFLNIRYDLKTKTMTINDTDCSLDIREVYKGAETGTYALMTFSDGFLKDAYFYQEQEEAIDEVIRQAGKETEAVDAAKKAAFQYDYMLGQYKEVRLLEEPVEVKMIRVPKTSFYEVTFKGVAVLTDGSGTIDAVVNVRVNAETLEADLVYSNL